MPLSSKQTRIYEFIKRYAQSNGVTPTISEIGRQFQMSSPASVHQVIGILEREGLVTKVPNVSRGIRLVEQPVNPS
jgi:SOS-response transcriptional repressor LexA